MGMERTRKQETQTLKQSLFPLLALALFGGGTFDLFKQQDRQALFQAVRGLGGGGEEAYLSMPTVCNLLSAGPGGTSGLSVGKRQLRKSTLLSVALNS